MTWIFISEQQEPFQAIYPRLSEGAIVIVDDYCDPDAHKTQNSLPGVKLACDEFLKDKKEEMELLSGGREFHAYFVSGGGRIIA